MYVQAFGLKTVAPLLRTVTNSRATKPIGWFFCKGVVMRKSLATLLIVGLLTSSEVRADGLSSFMDGCKKNAEFSKSGLSDLADVAKAFYCRGFVSGYYVSLFSKQELEEGSCRSGQVDADRLLTFLIAFYDAKRKQETGEGLALFESQPPEWFVEKAIVAACEDNKNPNPANINRRK